MSFSKRIIWFGFVASENLNSPSGSTFHIASFIVVWMFEKPVDRVDHERDENLAVLMLQQPLDQREGNARETERVDESERGCEVAAALINVIHHGPKLLMEATGLWSKLEISWSFNVIELLLEMFDTVLTLIDEPEDDLALDDLAMAQRHLERDQGRARLAGPVSTGPAKPVDVKDAPISSA